MSETVWLVCAWDEYYPREKDYNIRGIFKDRQSAVNFIEDSTLKDDFDFVEVIPRDIDE